ncbi:MAG: hypothetical protein ACRCY8_10075 [Dermatophilaceae bacterium]
MTGPRRSATEPGRPVVAVAARGDADALAVTLHGLRADHADTLRASSLMVLDDLPGGPQTALIADLARRYGATLLRYDEVDGWPTVEAVLELAPGSVVTVVEAGVLVRPGAIARASGQVSAGEVDVVAAAGSAPLDCWTARALPPRPAVRGFGAVDDVVSSCWRHARWTVARPAWMDVRRVLPRPAGAPLDVARNRLLGAGHTGAGPDDVRRDLAGLLGSPIAEQALVTVRQEWRSPLARQDAVYWFPDPATGTGWPGAQAELARDGVARPVRRFGYLDSSVGGSGRRALSWSTMARRAVRRRWERVVVVEGAFVLRPAGLERMRRDLERGGYGPDSPRSGSHRPVTGRGSPDVVHLDRSHPGDDAGPLAAVLLSGRALTALADLLPATTTEVRAADPASCDPGAVLRRLAAGGRLRVAGQREPVMERSAPTGRWLRR